MRYFVFVLISVLPLRVFADAPRVATDITPVFGLVTRVMDGVGAPDLVIPPGADPHGYSLRPSEAAALEQADVVFWIGESLSPWLEGPIETLAADATIVEMLAIADTQLIAFDDNHDNHDNHDDHEDHEEHADHDDHDGHDDHEEHADHDKHDDHDDHEEHADHGDHDDHAGHDHGPNDPHAWLDPQNGQVWLAAIAETLAEADPANADAYRKNAQDGIAELQALEAELVAIMAPMQGAQVAVSHNAYAYFERRFGLVPSLSVLSAENERPSLRRIAELRDQVDDLGIDALILDPGETPASIETVFEGVDIARCTVDPLGAHIAAGPTQYRDFIHHVAVTFSGCGKN